MFCCQDIVGIAPPVTLNPFVRKYVVSRGYITYSTSETNTSQPFITKKDLMELQEHVKINAKKIALTRKMVEDNRQWIRNLVGGYS
jgi:hypothetical protein